MFFVGQGSVTLSFGLMVYLLTAYLQISEGRPPPHMRHHHGDPRCRSCDPGWGVIVPCSKNRETECGRCSNGTYSPHHNVQPCWICSRCGPGLYEAHPCTKRADTVCDSCHRSPDYLTSMNNDFRKKCKGLNFFLAPEDAINTGEQSSLVNEPKIGFDAYEREIILDEDVRAYDGKDLQVHRKI